MTVAQAHYQREIAVRQKIATLYNMERKDIEKHGLRIVDTVPYNGTEPLSDHLIRYRGKTYFTLENLQYFPETITLLEIAR